MPTPDPTTNIPTTLDNLLSLLTACPGCLAGSDEMDPDDPRHTCGHLDWCELPTFGGDEPADTAGIWSWDATRLLVGSCASDLRIEDRPVTDDDRHPLAAI